MSNNRKILFYLHHHNDLDQIAPIVYEIGTNSEIPIDLVLDSTTTIGHERFMTGSDYRLEKLGGLKTVSIYDIQNILKMAGVSQMPAKQNLLQRMKTSTFLRRVEQLIPTEAPKRLFKSAVEETTKKRDDRVLDTVTDGYDDIVVASDWTAAKNPSVHILECAKERGYTTVVLPHGDSPYWNDIKKQSYFDDILNTDAIFESNTAWSSAAYSSYEKMVGHDYYLMPNKKTARRLEPFVPDDKVKVIGSPRYNLQWLETLSEIRPEYDQNTPSAVNVVLFARNKRYFVSETEVKNTIRLVTGFPDIRLVFKEHPRKGNIIESDHKLRDISNLEVIRDEVASAALNDWGDVFLEMGTSIIFEPIMRGKPVLSLDYTHGNYTTVSQYFSTSDIRSKDELYYNLHKLLEEGWDNFYVESEREKFIKEIITNNNDSVLKSYCDFFRSCFKTG